MIHDLTHGMQALYRCVLSPKPELFLKETSPQFYLLCKQEMPLDRSGGLEENMAS